MEPQCNLYQHLDRQLKSVKHLNLTNITPWLLFGQVKIFEVHRKFEAQAIDCLLTKWNQSNICHQFNWKDSSHCSFKVDLTQMFPVKWPALFLRCVKQGEGREMR